MAIFSWTASTSGDWNTGTLWAPASAPDSATADVTIDAATTLAYTVTIASGETETVHSLSMNGSNNFTGSYQAPYEAAKLELDGTLIFAAGSAGAFLGSYQTYVHEQVGASAAILNAGTVNAFIQAQGNLLLSGTNSVTISNELEALGGTVTIAAPIGDLTGNTLDDGIFNATGSAATINLGSASAGPIVSIATVAGIFGYTELTFSGPTAAINEWNGSTLVAVETTLRDIGAGGTVDVLGGRNYTTSGSLTIDETIGSSFFGAAMLNLQAGTVSVAGGININAGVVQGYGTIAGSISNNGTVIALGGAIGGTLDVLGSLTGTGAVAFDKNASTGGDPTEATLLLHSVSSGQTITLNDGGDTLVLATPAAFAGTIVAGTGGRFILQGLTAASAILNLGTLVVRNAGSQTVASLALAGSYAGDSFIASGSVVTILAPPTISGSVAGQTTSDHATIRPFARVAIGDKNFAQTETVSVTLSAATNGTLTNLGGGAYNAGSGVYTDTGSASAVTAALDGLVFTPTQGQINPGLTIATRFTISDTDTASKSAADNITTVIATAGTNVPTISGTLANQPISDQGTIKPFANVTIADANYGQTEQVKVTLSNANDGVLSSSSSSAGSYDAADGIYNVSGSASAVTSALQGLVFTPTPREAAPGQVITTTFAIGDTDTASQFAVNRTTTVLTTETAVPPTISGASPGQTTSDQATIAPFAQMVIADANFGQTETVTVTPSPSTVANGTLTNVGAGTYNTTTGVFTITGAASAVTVVLNALVFKPTLHQVAPGQTVTTGFTVTDTDTALQTANNSTTTVITTAGTVAPTISAAGGVIRPISDLVTIAPFLDVVIADANFGQTETVTVTLSSATNGSLTNLGGGTYDAVNGVYRDVGTTSQVSAAVDALVFAPAPHLVVPGGTVTTNFTIHDIDTALEAATDTSRTVVAQASTALPTIGGTVGGQTIANQGTIAPFANVLIGDVNFGQTETVTVTLSTPANGTLTNLGGGSFNAASGVYTITGSAIAVTNALDGLIFAQSQGTQVLTRFTITDIDTAGQQANTDSTTTVTGTVTAVAPTIGGTVSGQPVSDQATILPFANVVIGDGNPGQTEAVTVALSPAGDGTLTNLGGGSYNPQTGAYSVTGSAAVVTAALNGWVFTPTLHQVAPGQTVTTTFTITDTDTASQTATNVATTVIATAGTVAPTISLTQPGQSVSDQGTIAPFSNVVIGDLNFGQTETVTVSLPAANGTLTNLGGGSYNRGVYTDIGTAAAVTTALEGLVFTPTAHQVAPGQTVTTTFAISDVDTAQAVATNTTTSVIATAGTVAPTISGALAGQITSDQGTITPFATVSIGDVNLGQTETVTVSLSLPANGTLTSLGGGSFNPQTGVYTDVGSVAAVTTALEGLVFTPTAHEVAPGQTVTTTFAISDVDTAQAVATSSTTSVIATAGTVAPTISGALAGLITSDQGTITPFATVSIGDVNFGQTETVTVSLSLPANGTLTNLGGGSYNRGVYTDVGSVAAVTTALAALVFTPTAHQVALGGTVTTTFTISDTDTAQQTATDNTTTVIATATAVLPTISGTAGGWTTTDEASIAPFVRVVIADANAGQTETVTVTLSAAANGALTDVDGGTYNASTGVYAVTGSAAVVTAALQALVFVPTRAQVAGGQTVTTGFRLSVTDTAGASTVDTATTVAVATTTVGAPAGEVILSGSSAQYIIADDIGSLYIQDTVAARNGTQVLPGITVMSFTDGMALFDPTGTAEDISRLYEAALDRAPDLAGLQAWTGLVDDSHAPLSVVATDFTTSMEFIHDYGSLSDTAFVEQLYQNVLGRPADAAGLQDWTGLLASGGSRGTVLLGFAESPEFEADTLSDAGDNFNGEAYRLYVAALNRVPDPAGQAAWAAYLASGATLTQAAQGFVDSTEFIQDYGALSISDFVTVMYRNVLHRAPDQAGQQAWTNFMLQGGSEESVLIGFSDSIENRAQTAGATHANWVFIPT